MWPSVCVAQKMGKGVGGSQILLRALAAATGRKQPTKKVKFNVMYNRPHELERPVDESQDNFAFHPKNIYLALLLFSLSMLFLAMTAAFVYTRVAE